MHYTNQIFKLASKFEKLATHHSHELPSELTDMLKEWAMTHTDDVLVSPARLKHLERNIEEKILSKEIETGEEIEEGEEINYVSDQFNYPRALAGLGLGATVTGILSHLRVVDPSALDSLKDILNVMPPLGMLDLKNQAVEAAPMIVATILGLLGDNLAMEQSRANRFDREEMEERKRRIADRERAMKITEEK